MAVHAGHGQVEDPQEDVGVLLDERDGLLAVGRGQHLETVRRQQIAIRGQKLRIVVDDQKLPQFELFSTRSYRHSGRVRLQTAYLEREARRGVAQRQEL